MYPAPVIGIPDPATWKERDARLKALRSHSGSGATSPDPGAVEPSQTHRSRPDRFELFPREAEEKLKERTESQLAAEDRERASKKVTLASATGPSARPPPLLTLQIRPISLVPEWALGATLGTTQENRPA